MEDFVVSRSVSDLLCLEIKHAPPKLHAYLKSVVMAQDMRTEEYDVSKKALAFFQCGSAETEGYVLIEFWKDKGAQEFVDFINKNKKKWECD